MPARIIRTNRIAPAASLMTASSVENGFSVTWLRDQLRSKPWRSRLGWNITDQNNKIDFTEAGTARVGTLALGNYATGAAMAAAVQNAMNAAKVALLTPTAWYRADNILGGSVDPLSHLADGAFVTQWDDVSGNARHLTQAGSAKQPLFRTARVNGLPTIVFDGINDSLASSSTWTNFVGAQAATIYVVGKVATGQTGIGTFLADSQGMAHMDFQVAGTNYRSINYDGTFDIAQNSAAAGAFRLLLLRHDTTNVSAGLDDSDDAALANTASGANTNLTGVLRVGTASGDTDYLNGEIAEILTFNSALSEESRRTVAKYLALKYGIADNTTAPAANMYASDYSAGSKIFSISRSAGADALVLKFLDGANLAASVHPDLGYTSTNKSGATAYDAEGVAHHSREWVKVDLGSALAFQVGMVLNHNMGAGGTAKLQAHTSDAWSAPDVSETLVGTDGLRIKFLAASQSKRYLRLLIDDVSNDDGYSEVGVWWAAPYEEPTVNYSIDEVWENQDFSVLNRSDHGALYADERQQGWAWALSWLDIGDADKATLQAWKEACPVGRCFFFAFDPVTTPADTEYVCFAEPMGIRVSAGDYWTVAVKLAEALG